MTTIHWVPLGRHHAAQARGWNRLVSGFEASLPKILCMPERPQFEVYLYVADAREGEDLYRFTAEHWFTDPPDIETVAALFDEAKRHFSVLYPDVDAENFSVEIRRLRRRDVGAQDAQPGLSSTA